MAEAFSAYSSALNLTPPHCASRPPTHAKSLNSLQHWSCRFNLQIQVQHYSRFTDKSLLSNTKSPPPPSRVRRP